MTLTGGLLICEHILFHFQSNLNMAYCCLFLFGKIIQRVVFGDLRASELQVSLKAGQFVSASKEAYFPWFNWC